MFNGIMNLMNSLEARYKEDIEDCVIDHTENEYNILLAIDPLTLAFSGIAIAGGGVLNFSEEQVATIIVDTNYLTMSENAKRFTIAHELGHLVHQIEKFKAGNYVRNIEDEFEADEYALEQLGLEVAIEGLNEVKAILIKYSVAEEHINEIDIRIENLMNKSLVNC